MARPSGHLCFLCCLPWRAVALERTRLFSSFCAFLEFRSPQGEVGSSGVGGRGLSLAERKFFALSASQAILEPGHWAEARLDKQDAANGPIGSAFVAFPGHSPAPAP